MNSVKEILLKLKELGGYVIDTNQKLVITREQLGETISTNYEDAVEALEEGLFLDAFEVADPGMNDILKAIEGKYADANQVIFYLQYELNPNLPFTYKEILYRDVATLGQAILNDKGEKETILEAIKFKLFSFYAKFKQLDLVRTNIIDIIDYAENYYEKNKDTAYVLLGYCLSDRKYYKYDNKKFLSVVTFYTYLTDKKKLTRFSNEMDKDILFTCWLYSLGHAETYERWLETVKKIDMLDYDTYVSQVPTQNIYTPVKEINKVKIAKPKRQKKKVEKFKITN